MANYVRLPRGRGVIPEGEVVHLKYYDHFPITSTLGTPTAKYYRLNSIFDPDVSVGGHQPLGRDQLATLYNQYLVYRCSWRITATNLIFATTNVDQTFKVVVLPFVGTSAAVPPALVEQPRALMKVVTPMGDEGNVKVFKGSIHLAELAGITKDEYYSERDVFGAAMGADPTPNLLLGIVAWGDGGVTAQIQFTIQLTYDVIAYDSVNLTAS